MQELSDIVIGLRQTWASKESELNNSGQSFSAYVYGALANAKTRIDLFEQQSKLVNVSIVEKPQVIENFKKEARVMEAEIVEIGK